MNVELDGLKEHGVDGKIGFSIKADDTVENQEIHKMFQVYCLHKTRNDYTQGLKLLLQRSYELEEFEYSELIEKVEQLETRIAVLEAKSLESKEKDEGLF